MRGLMKKIFIPTLLLSFSLHLVSCRTFSQMFSRAAGPDLQNGPEGGIPHRLYFRTTLDGREYRLFLQSDYDSGGEDCRDKMIYTRMFRLKKATYENLDYDYMVNPAGPCEPGNYIIGRLRRSNIDLKLFYTHGSSPWQALRRARQVSGTIRMPGGLEQKTTWQALPSSGRELLLLARGVNFLQKRRILSFAKSVGGFGLEKEPLFLVSPDKSRISWNKKLYQVSPSHYTSRSLAVGLSPATTGQRGSWSAKVWFQLAGPADDRVLVFWGRKTWHSGLQDRGSGRSPVYLPVSVWKLSGDTWQKIHEVNLPQIYKPGSFILEPVFLRKFLFQDPGGQPRHLSWDGKALSLKDGFE